MVILPGIRVKAICAYRHDSAHGSSGAAAGGTRGATWYQWTRDADGVLDDLDVDALLAAQGFTG